eukprot:2519939-Pleurochrysis_carterae.AAC.1
MSLHALRTPSERVHEQYASLLNRVHVYAKRRARGRMRACVHERVLRTCCAFAARMETHVYAKRREKARKGAKRHARAHALVGLRTRGTLCVRT